MIDGLVPDGVVTVATRSDLVETALFPEELRALGDAVPRRRREFVTARACAREAMARLGLPDQPVASGRWGDPLWPGGVVGSITHCDRYRACAVARSREIGAIGIDAEIDEPLPDGVLATVASSSERRALAALAGPEHWDRLLFSAKEAVFKAWFPLTGRRLAFEDAEIEIDPDRGTFTDRATGLTGRWRAEHGIVATAVVLAA